MLCVLTEVIPGYKAFKLKMRTDVLPNASTTDVNSFEEKIRLTKEIAEVLRKNIVQARRVENPASEEKWRMFDHYANGLQLTQRSLRVAHNRAHGAR